MSLDMGYFCKVTFTNKVCCFIIKKHQYPQKNHFNSNEQRPEKKVIFEGKKSCFQVIKKCKISDRKGKKSDLSTNILQGLHGFLYKLQLQQGQSEQNGPLLQLMASVKYLSVTATATGTHFCLCLCCSCSCGSAFLKSLTATETNLVAPVQVAVAP